MVHHLARQAAGLALFSLALTAFALPGAASAASVEAGRQIAQRNCGMCHAIGVHGDSPNAHAPPFRGLSNRYPVESLGEALAEGIRTGHNNMPEFRFESGEITDLIAYINSIQVRSQARLYAPGPSSR